MIVNDAARSRRVIIVAALVLAFCQLALVPNIAFLSGRANLALVLVALACLGGKSQSAPAIGFAAGLFFDLSGTGPIGLMALMLTPVAYVLAVSGRSRVADDLPGTLAIFCPLALALALAYALVLLALGQASSFFDAVVMRALPGAVLDCAAMALVGFVLGRVQGSRGLGAHGGGSHLSVKGL